MMLSEFVERINTQAPSLSDYKTIEYVYVWHPSVPDVGGKDYIARLYDVGGMGVIRSMVSVAEQAEEIDRQASVIRSRIASLNEKLHSIYAPLQQYK